MFTRIWLVVSTNMQPCLPKPKKRLFNCVQPHQATEALCYRQFTSEEGSIGEKVPREAIPQLKPWQRSALRRAGELFGLGCFTRWWYIP